AIMMWTYTALLPGLPVQGAITGRVLRAQPLPGGGTDYVGVGNVRVERDDRQDPVATVAITAPDGRYVITRPHFTTGATEIRATAPGGGVYKSTAYAVALTDTKIDTDDGLANLKAQGMFQNLAFANVLLPATEIPPPAPEITIRVMRTVDGQRQDTG